MNIQEYISSGIIESYVLGLADDAERAEFERMCAMHSEVAAARQNFEIALEEHAMLDQTQPPKNLKSRIFASIDIENDQKISGTDRSAESGFQPAAPVNDMRPRSSVGPGWSRYLAAAAVVLLLISTGLNLYFFNRSRFFSEQYRDLLAQQTQLVSNNQLLQTRLLEYERAVEMVKDPNMIIVKMPAIPASPDPTSATTVFWHSVSKDVFLAVNKLPTPAADQQYQLWAMVDGKPVDAGVFDIRDGAGIVKMKNIPKAQAFAITLEKRGGSPTPNLDKLYVMGKV